jgi:hypothetical protein
MTDGSVVCSGVERFDVARAGCPECGCELLLHQPDESLADRLLATCDECKAWFLTGPEVRDLVRLPGIGLLVGARLGDD